MPGESDSVSSEKDLTFYSFYTRSGPAVKARCAWY